MSIRFQEYRCSWEFIELGWLSGQYFANFLCLFGVMLEAKSFIFYIGLVKYADFICLLFSFGTYFLNFPAMPVYLS